MATLAEQLFTDLEDFDYTDTFCAELAAEWFVEGQLSNEKIGAYTSRQAAQIKVELSERWDDKTSELFADAWVEHS